MKISISELKTLMRKKIQSSGVSSKNCEFVINYYIEAELIGKKSHGIGKFCWESQYFKERLGSPFIEKDLKTILTINGNKELGPLAAKFAVELLKKRSKKYGLAIVFMKNAQRYGALNTWARILAENNLIGLVMNTSEPLVAYPGALTNVLGTNPLGIGIPATKPVIIDMATSKKAMGLTWQCLRENSKLPDQTFFDSKGKYTTNPRLAKSVEVFGGYKGFYLSLFIQMFCDSLWDNKKTKNKFDFGYVFFAFNPSFIINIKKFKNNNDLLIKKIKSSKTNNKVKIIIPGEKTNKAPKRKYLDITLSVYKELKKNISL
jgi:L-2-hydroxycarboxylate dehydrogenase (NAD+)